MSKYNPKKIEAFWQKKWEEENIYSSKNSKDREDNKYVLVEFAYPSGNLHVGHWYAFSVPDIYVRYQRMLGKNVMYPIGFDAFGLPAENAAIKNKLNPRKWTFDNIEYMRKQLRSMGASFDWSREIITASPEYYKWTQWLFLKFLEKGLAYQSETPVNWCPSCKTVLANEQVVSGKCERCGTLVTKRNMLQWNFKITDYADRLIDDLEKLDWPKSIKESQKNWIGRSEGALISFELKDSSLELEVFTTRPDTIFGATYLVLSPEHEAILKLKSQILNFDEVISYVEKSKAKTEIERTSEDKEKTGVELKGVVAINPSTKKEIPVWVADYVLVQYGTGAIMAVPADDKRDKEFAEKFDLQVIEKYEKAGFEDYGKKTIKYKLRDWVVSRQRYWGCPIPVIHCPKCGTVPVPEKDLPVVLPEIDDYLPSDDGKSPLSKAEEWVNTKCPNCKKEAKRETDTLDTFVDSSWYFLRYTDPRNNKEFASEKEQKKWMPVDFYSGGAEHTTMHLLYSRFFHKSLFDMNLVVDEEPYKRRMNRGLILGEDGQKMSKSKGNVVDPDKEVEIFGADTVRTYLAFIGPYNEVGSYPWNPGGAIGVRRFLDKVWRISEKVSKKAEDGDLEIPLHKTIKKVSEGVEAVSFNTAVSSLMVLANEMDKKENISKNHFELFLKMLAPFAPHITEELWNKLGNKKTIHLEKWPQYDKNKIVDERIKIVVQVNGKVRGMFESERGKSDKELTENALQMKEIKKWIDGAEVQKIIFIPEKLINIVLKSA